MYALTNGLCTCRALSTRTPDPGLLLRVGHKPGIRIVECESILDRVAPRAERDVVHKHNTHTLRAQEPIDKGSQPVIVAIATAAAAAAAAGGLGLQESSTIYLRQQEPQKARQALSRLHNLRARRE